jgi:uncharacterized membrane protein
MGKHLQWLYEELPALVRQGVLTPEAAEKLRQHYGPATRPDARRLTLVLFGVLGAVLIGGGIILLLAHNWDELLRPVRAALSFAPLLAALLLAAWVLRRRAQSTAWRESVATYWGLSIGSSIALIAQTYNLGGDFGDFVLTWALLGLPIVYLLQSRAVAALYWAGVTAWAIFARITNGVELWFWPLLALAVPHLWRIARPERDHARVGWLIWVLALCLSIGTGASLVEHLADLWTVVYGSLFTVMWLAGRRWFDEGESPRRQPLQSIGALGLFVLSLLLTFKSAWEELTWHSHWWESETPFVWLRVAVLAVWPVAAMCLWGNALRRLDIPGAIAGLMPLLAALGFVLGSQPARNIIMPLVFDAFVLAAGIALVVGGVRERRLSVTNGGMLVVAALIIARFFDSDLDFVARGLAFVIVGAGFLVTNLVLVKKMRVAQ